MASRFSQVINRLTKEGYPSQREGQGQGPWGGPFFAILRKSSKMTILRISGISILYHVINMTINEIIEFLELDKIDIFKGPKPLKNYQ